MMEDIDQLIGLLPLLPEWTQHALAYSAVLALALGLVVKPIAVRIAPPEQWPAWVRGVFAVLDVAAANSATVWRLAQLGETKRALRAASIPPASVEPWDESPRPPTPPRSGLR